ncbi:MAG: peptide-methionine (S)-S-oxide reductase MsrA [Pacificimonas sp.]
MRKLLISLAAGTMLASCSAQAQNDDGSTASTDLDRAYFAMGCFWCGEADFEKIDGVTEVVSGYAGGTTDNPTYDQVTGGNTGHYEAIEVRYDPDVVSYNELLNVFWRNVDPLDARGQFCDKGSSYLSAIFPRNAPERDAAAASLDRVEARFDQPVATKIVAAPTFYRAEEYHQDYYEKNPIRYKFYRSGCRRDERLEELWG